VAEREAATPRRRRPVLWAAGTALVAVGGLSTAVLVGRAGDRVEVLAVARTVPVGQTITAADVTVARIPVDPALQPVPAGARNRVVGQVAAVELRAGSLLTGGAVTHTAVPGPGEQVVGVAAGSGQLPARGLKPGDRVLVVPVPGGSGGPAEGGGSGGYGDAGGVDGVGNVGDEASPVATAVQASVAQVGPADANGTSTVDVLVDAEVGPRVAVLASTGRVALVLLSAGGR
jgi:hypothetical protein